MERRTFFAWCASFAALGVTKAFGWISPAVQSDASYNQVKRVARKLAERQRDNDDELCRKADNFVAALEKAHAMSDHTDMDLRVAKLRKLYGPFGEGEVVIPCRIGISTQAERSKGKAIYRKR